MPRVNPRERYLEYKAAIAPEPLYKRKYHYREAFIKSPKLGINLIRVDRISEGLAILRAIGEGTLHVCTRKRTSHRVLAMAECHLNELRNKSEAEIFALLDKKTDELSRTLAGQYVMEDRIGLF
jgi:hypothetical protein